MSYWLRDGVGQFNEAFIEQALDAANEIEGDYGFAMAVMDPDMSDGRRSAEWFARMLGCIDPVAI